VGRPSFLGAPVACPLHASFLVHLGGTGSKVSSGVTGVVWLLLRNRVPRRPRQRERRQHVDAQRVDDASAGELQSIQLAACRASRLLVGEPGLQKGGDVRRPRGDF
jgi:hypothetical protein